MEEFGKNDIKTDWDMAFATYFRIHNLCIMASNYHLMDDIEGYYKTLRNLRKEVVVKIKHTTKAGACVPDCPRCEYDKVWADIEKKYTLMTMGHSDPNFRRRYLQELDHFEILLRCFMDKKGMMIKEREYSGL